MKYKYTLTIEFESDQPIAEERLDFTMREDPVSDHVTEIMMHRNVRQLKETIEYQEGN